MSKSGTTLRGLVGQKYGFCPNRKINLPAPKTLGKPRCNGTSYPFIKCSTGRSIGMAASMPLECRRGLCDHHFRRNCVIGKGESCQCRCREHGGALRHHSIQLVERDLGGGKAGHRFRYSGGLRAA